MKRGKRQVLQSENNNMNNQSNYDHTNVGNFLSSIMNVNNRFKHNENHHQQQRYQNSTSVNKLQTRTLQQKQTEQPVKINEMDQKKRKIQLLKQKYLKKNKQEEVSNQQIDTYQKPHLKHNQEPIATQTVPNIQIPEPISINTIVQASKINNLPIKNHIKDIQLTQNNIHHKFQKIGYSSEKAQSTSNETNQETPTPIVTKQIPQQQIFKPSTRNPPPPNIRKPNPPPPPVKNISLHNPVQETNQIRYNEVNQKIQNYEGQQILLSLKQLDIKNVVSQIEQIIDNPHQIEIQKQKPADNRSFAPPSSQVTHVQKNHQKVPPPPPPINKNMKQILKKRLGSSQVPKPPIKSPLRNNRQTTQQAAQPQLSLFDTPFQQSSVNIPPPTRNKVPRKPKNVEIDEQYKQQPIISKENTQLKSQKRQTDHHNNQYINPLQLIGEWMGSPQLTLKELFPQLKETIQFYCLNKHKSLQIISTNSTFTFLTGEFYKAFVINNSGRLTQDQKSVTQALGLNFFYSNSAEFSDVFLVSLFKMGEQYLEKYEKALQDKFIIYLTKIINFKNLFLNEQIDTFVNFCLKKNFVQQTNFLQFLMLASQNSQLITLLNNTQIHDLRYAIAILSFCKLNLKNKNLMGLYLKSISNLAPQFVENGLVQKILNHLKQLDVPQSFYQLSKQLKLRLLKNYDNQKQIQDKNVRLQAQNNHTTEVVQPVKDKGLFGYFNINKAIDKIKTSTQKALGAIQKQTKPEQEEKKDEIVYDPIKKRYIINGQIPEDENQRKDDSGVQSRQKVPPPPTGLIPKKSPPPPPGIHGKKPIPRVPNRYV